MDHKLKVSLFALSGAILVAMGILSVTKVQAEPSAQATATTMAPETVTPVATESISATVTVSATTEAGTPAPMTGMDMSNGDAAKYCTDNGGTVTTRYPAYNTNAPQEQWLRLAGSRDFCTFYATADETGFQSQISIALDTLYADQPTLAVLAYLEPLSLPPFTGANPSTLYCTKLGGSDVWGGQDNAAGGGWVTDASDSKTNFQIVNMCVFPDGSAIDSWGLAYKANGVVRGQDLTKLVRYQPATLPNVFMSQTTVDKMLTNADNNSSVSLKVGDTLTVALASNPSTGFSWKLSANDAGVLQAVGEPKFELGNKTPMPGAGGTETFTFNAVGKGKSTLTLVYVRPWEKTVTPTPPNVWTVTVTVE